MHWLSRWTCVLMVVVPATVFAQQITGNTRGTVGGCERRSGASGRG